MLYMIWMIDNQKRINRDKKMRYFKRCLELLDELGNIGVEELMNEVECSRTVATYAISAYRYYRGIDDE